MTVDVFLALDVIRYCSFEADLLVNLQALKSDFYKVDVLILLTLTEYEAFTIL